MAPSPSVKPDRESVAHIESSVTPMPSMLPASKLTDRNERTHCCAQAGTTAKMSLRRLDVAAAAWACSKRVTRFRLERWFVLDILFGRFMRSVAVH